MATAISPTYQHEAIRRKSVQLTAGGFAFSIEPPAPAGIIPPIVGQLFPFLYLFILIILV